MGDRLLRIKDWAVRNSPQILTGLGVVGLIGHTVVSGNAAIKAERVLREMKEDGLFEYVKEHPENKEEKKAVAVDILKGVVVPYLPVLATGAFTIFCFTRATGITAERAAALGMLYSTTEQAFKTYRGKVLDHLSPEKEQEVYDSVAETKFLENYDKSTEAIATGYGDLLCYDVYSGRYFRSTIDMIRRAERSCIQEGLIGLVSLNDFYERLNIDTIPLGDSVGWDFAHDEGLEVIFTSVLDPNGVPALAITYEVYPFRNQLGW